MKELLTINDDSHSNCFDSYRKIAEKLMNNYKLQVRHCFFRIVECEFYFHSNNHQDPYVHGHERQKKTLGEWYFHGSGLDITLGMENGYGGILIRGIAKVTHELPIPHRKDAIIGPLNVVSEIFAQIGASTSNSPINFGLLDTSIEQEQANSMIARVFSIPRIGLNPSNGAPDNFFIKPYRFITFLHLQHKEIEKIRKYLVEESRELTVEQYSQYYKGEKC